MRISGPGAVLSVAIVALFFWATIFVPNAAQAQVSEADSLALVALYDSTDGDNWSNNAKWKSSEPVGSWRGVTVANGRVTEVRLFTNRLSGSIPSEIGDMTNLQKLYLHNNDLSGSIPSEIGDLTSLTTLYLYNNDLSGSIPSEIGDLTSLTTLRLYNNDLSGSISSEIGDLTSLEELWLYNNDLSGSIPSEIGGLTSLEELRLNDNDLSGSIPSEIGRLTSLEDLRLNNNDLSGSIPSEIGDLTSLEDLRLNHNELSGSIPPEIGALTNLQQLSLRNNELSGSIPSEIGGLTSLEELRLNDNNLSGPIPSEIEGLTSLKRLYLNNNNLSGSIPSEIGNMTELKKLFLYNNSSLEGTLPLGLMNLRNLDTINIQNTCITTPSNSDFQTWLTNLGSGRGFTDTEKSCTPSSVTVTPTSLTVAEEDSTTYSVVLDTQPSGNVTITLSFASGADADITAEPTSLTFTADNWDTAQEVEVKAAEDDDAINGTATIEHTASGGGYASVSIASVTVVEDDDDTAGVTVMPTSLTVAEEDSATYSVVLDTQPSGDVMITLSLASGADADITAEPTSLTFTADNWDTAQEVEVKAAEDDDAVNGTATIEHTVSGYGTVTASSVMVTERDDDTAGVTVTPMSLDIPEGSNAKYAVALTSQPSADVMITVSLASGADSDITANKTSLTFTADNWNAAQEVTLSAAEDDDAINGRATIEHAASGGDYGSVSVSSVTATESDNDTAGVTVTPMSLDIPEGSNAKYEVVLDTKPSANVTITVSLASGSDADITATRPLLTFTTGDWNVAQEVTASAAEDDDAINGSATIEHSVSGGDYAGVTASSVTATESDNDTAGVTVTPTSLDIPEGSNAKYEVVLTSEPSGDVTITLSLASASASDADITIDKTSLTFTADNWNAAQEVTASVAEDDDAINGAATIEHAVSGGDYTDVTASSVTATESDNDTAGVTVAPMALSVTEGSSEKYTIVLDTQPSGDVTITVSFASGSDADITIDKTSLTFTTGNWNVAQEVTASAAEDDDAIAGIATIDHAVSGGDYAGVPASSVTAAESDNDAAGVTINPTAVTVDEGSSVKYTVALTTQPSAEVTIAVSFASDSDADITINKTSLTFTTGNWNVEQEVTASAAEDDDAIAGIATIDHAVSGGDYAGVTAFSVTVTESDNDAAGVTINPTALAITEGSIAKYEVVLTSEPSDDVTISLSFAAGSDANVTATPTSLTFTAGNWSAAQEVMVSAAEDDDAINGAATIDHAVSGGDYTDVTASSVTAAESDNDAAGVTMTPTALAITEGSSAKYTVALTSQPSGDVTISLSFAAGSDTDITVDKTSLTFTPDNWSAAQEVTASASEDDDATDGAATIEHAVSGGDYTDVTASSVTATEADNDAAGVTVTPTTLTVPEGFSAKYTVVLGTQPSADVTISVSFASDSDTDITTDKPSLTFTPDNWSAAQEVIVSAADDTDTANGAATIEHAASGGGYGRVSVSSVTATEADNDAAGVTVTPTALTVVEGSSAKYAVALTSQPSTDVTISLSFASGSDADITADKTSLTFTMSDWNAAQEVIVSAAEDTDAANGAATIEHTASGEGYGGVSVSSVTATEADNDAAGMAVTPTALTVTEGSNAKYAVALTSQPSADVTISLIFASGSDEDITVDKTSLTFTPDTWNEAQEVIVSAAEDTDTANGSATIEHTASGGGYDGVTASSVTATEADNDAAGVTVTPTALTVVEGDSAKYTVVLDTQPSGDVTISLVFASGSDEDITVDKTSLTFTTDTWNVAQEITVSAAEDDDATNGTATIEHEASGGGYDDVTVDSVTATEADNDAVAGVTVTPTALTVAEGDSAKYTVVLDTQPSGDVTISLSFASGSDADVTADKTSLTFTTDTWSAAQEVTVSATEDDDATNGTATIEHAASGGGYDDVTVDSVTATEADNDAVAGVTVTPTALTVAEGDSAKYTVVLDTQPSGDVTISLSFASGSDADVTVDKMSLTFTTENWDAAQEVTVSAAEDDDAISGAAEIEHEVSGANYVGVTAGSVTVTEGDDNTAGITVTPPTLTVPEGGNATYTVALDTQPSEDVTISVSFASGSDEDVTVDKTSLTFTPESWSTAQGVTVSAAEDPDIENDSALLNHKASGGDYSEVSIPDAVIEVTDKHSAVDVSAWLARSSRVSADHLLSSVENRMEWTGRSISGMQASVAGQRLAFGDAQAQPGESFSTFSGASALWSASQDYTMPSMGYSDGYGASSGRSMRLRDSYGISSNLNAAASRYRNLTLRDALSRSAFRYARQASSGNTLGVWGQGAFSRFGGSEGGADLTGDVTSGMIGIDNSFSGWLHGLAFSRSESEGAYRIAGEESFSLSTTLTGIYPYMRYKFTDRLQVWGTGGYGRGSLHMEQDSFASFSSSSDLSMALGSVGMSGDIVSAGSQGFGLSWQTDAMLLRSSLDASRLLAASKAVVHRLRLALKSSWILKMGDRASLAPKLQLGARRDGGNAEQGMGMDVAGGLGFIHSGWGLRAQVDMHGLVAHEDSDFEQWGVSGMIMFDRSPSTALGPSLRLSPSWGAPSSSGGMRTLWSRETVSGLASLGQIDGAEDRSLRLDSRFDYGIAVGENGVAAPYASASFSGSETQSASADADVEIGGGLGYSNESLGLRMRAGMRGLMSEEEAGFEAWGASGILFFDLDPSSPLGASFNVSQSWGIAHRTGFGGSQSMGTMREREPLPRSVTGLSRNHLYGQPLRVEGEMGYGFSASGGKGVATPYAGVAFSDRDRSGVLVGFNLQAGRRFLLNVEGSTPEAGAISFDSLPEFRVRSLLKW